MKNFFLHQVVITLSLIAALIGSISLHPAYSANASEIQPQTSMATIAPTLEAILKQEKEFNTGCLEKLDIEKTLTASLAREMSAYRLQFATAENLLFMSGADYMALMKARNNIRLIIENLAPRLDPLEKRLGQIELSIEEAKRQSDFNRQRIDDFKKGVVSGTYDKNTGKSLTQIDRVLKEKIKCLSGQQSVIKERVLMLTKAIEAADKLTNRFDDSIETRKQQALFLRAPFSMDSLSPDKIADEIKDLKKILTNLTSQDYYKTFILPNYQGKWHITIMFIILALITVASLKKLKRRIKKLKSDKALFFEERPAAQVLAELLVSSVTPGGILAFMAGFSVVKPLPHMNILIQPAMYILLVIISARWVRKGVFLWYMLYRKETEPAFLKMITFFINAIKWFWIIYILATLTLSSTSLLLPVIRLGFQICILVWIFIFWKRVRQKNGTATPSEEKPVSGLTTPVIKWTTYFIAATGLVLELTGFVDMTVHWYSAWGLTSAAAVWAYFGIRAIREWDGRNRTISSKTSDEEEKHNTYPMVWFCSKIGMFMLLVLFTASIAYFWGARESVFSSVLQIIEKPYKIGSLNISISGFFYALAVLLLTQAGTSLWKSVFNKKILKNSGITVGLRESITTITVYGIWAIGILIAFHVFGMDTTSITVALGALSIGLGFGLQNIFSNFISGIILLFERPVQVGDIIEVEGSWAEVTKINFRSTLVQTYTNASLIIPNSELISNKVINWSHKDPWIRRDLEVGVAYGSDVEKVRDILLDLAGKKREIRFRPAPKVLFSNFGESSLDFKLRFWTHVDTFLRVESELRFEVNRLFNENGIEIPFPQRDLHIRSGLEQKNEACKENNVQEDADKPADSVETGNQEKL